MTTSPWRRLVATDAPAATWLVRLVVGWVFLSEGVQKLLFRDQLGVGRFTKIGLPAPDVLAPFVAVNEIACGALLAAGLLTRLAAVPLTVIISVALWTTKRPMLLHDGFWKAAHESRTDLAMLFCLLFLLRVGGGAGSLDARIARR